MSRITEKQLQTAEKQARAKGKPITLGCSDPPGFCCRVSPKGRRTFFLRVRKRGAKERHEPIKASTVGDARTLARALKDSGETTAGLTLVGLKQKHISFHDSPNPDARTWSDEHLRNEKAMLRNWIAPLFGRIDASKVTADIIDEKIRAVESWEPQGRLKGGLCVARNMRKSMKEAFDFAIRREIGGIVKNPVKQAKQTVRARVDHRVVTKEEEEKIITFLDSAWRSPQRTKGHVNKNACYMFRLQMITGWRLSMVRDLRWEYLDLAGGWIEWPEEPRKKKAEHRMPIHRGTIEFLKKWGPKRRGLVFPNAAGKRFMNGTQLFQRIKKGAGVEGFGSHALRRTAATKLNDAGVPIPRIAEFIGHTDSRSTLRYVKASQAEQRIAFSNLIADIME